MHTTAWFNKGNTLLTLGKYRKAIAAYNRVIRIMPNDVDALHNKGYALDALGKYKEALIWFDQAIKTNAKIDEVLWNSKGRAFYFLGKNQEALACYDRALKINIKYAPAWNNKGRVLDALGKYRQALFCYNRTIKLDPYNINAWYNKSKQRNKKIRLRSLKNARILLILPCNAAACIGDYFRAEVYTEKEWNTWKEADFCLSEHRYNGKVAFAALDSSTLETEPHGAKGAIVFETEMARAKNPTGKDWGAPNWRWFRPTATGNCEYLKTLTESLVKGIRRVKKMGFSQVFTLVNPRGYFLSLAAAVDKCGLLDKWVVFRVPSHPRHLLTAVRQISPFVRAAAEGKKFKGGIYPVPDLYTFMKQESNVYKDAIPRPWREFVKLPNISRTKNRWVLLRTSIRRGNG
jgi:hypothetical protein